MTRLDIERTELRAFTAEVGDVAARSLPLLRDIEHTLNWLEHRTRLFETLTEFADKVNDQLDKIVGVIDADGSLSTAMEDAQQAIDEVYRALIDKRQSGRDDTRLTEDDGIEAAYTEAIAAAADLHNAINRLRWNIGEHDVDAEPRISNPERVFSDPDKLEAYLRSL